MPVAALIDDKIICMHGGLSPELSNIRQIYELNKPSEVPDSGKIKSLINKLGLLCDLLWSDPEKDIKEFLENDRGVSCIFGEKQVKDFNRKNELDLIIRAHQVS